MKPIVMKPLKVKVSITLDEDIVSKVKALSEMEDRSFSQYVNLVLKHHVREKKENQNDDIQSINLGVTESKYNI